jgi:hypothetical protein
MHLLRFWLHMEREQVIMRDHQEGSSFHLEAKLRNSDLPIYKNNMYKQLLPVYYFRHLLSHTFLNSLRLKVTASMV